MTTMPPGERLLQATAEQARDILELAPIYVVAVAGYFRSEDIAACEKTGRAPPCPKYPVH